MRTAIAVVSAVFLIATLSAALGMAPILDGVSRLTSHSQGHKVAQTTPSAPSEPGLVKIQHGNLKLKEVALTFDDGPHPLFTPQLLTLLRQYNIKATFFVVGKMAQKYPDLVKDEVAAGHLVGNHTFNHVNLTRIPDAKIQAEWQSCNDVIKSILGKPATFCRPPGGDVNSEVMAAAHRCGLTTVLWTDDPGDYASPGDNKIESRTLSRIRNGGIILLHDGIQQTIDVLPQIIEHLQRRGYKFVTMEEMARHL